jgi:hypothetical protein
MISPAVNGYHKSTLNSWNLPVSDRSSQSVVDRMTDQTYLVRLKPPSEAIQRVVASRFEINNEHLVFVDSRGQLAALFLMELVESWNALSD